MRKVVIRAVPEKPNDGQRRKRLLELLSTGLQRLVLAELGLDDSTPPVDYSPNLPVTSYTDTKISEEDD